MSIILSLIKISSIIVICYLNKELIISSNSAHVWNLRSKGRRANKQKIIKKECSQSNDEQKMVRERLLKHEQCKQGLL